MIAKLKAINWTSRSAAIAVAGIVALLIIVAMVKCSPEPRVDPKLGKALNEKTEATAETSNERIEQAAPVIAAKVMDPIKTHIRRTQPHVAKLRTRTVAPAPPGVVHVPDDDFYSSVCEPGGLYAGRPDRSSECSKLASGD